ncbi:MAG: hypothetical protein IPO63_01545 [Bacteroidetes bacterium]|nr:hypothetical protein [Bacteroidota bacterium]
MKSILTSLLLMLLSNSFVFSQSLITVQHNGTPTFFASLDSAIIASQNGDTIYVPGGSFNLTTSINKILHVFGVGHNPDSTLATDRTVISGGVNLLSGASGGSLTGIYFQSGTTYNTGQILFSDNVIGYKISRCYISGGISCDSAGTTNIVISECMIGEYSLCFTCSNWYSISMLTSVNNLISNNITKAKVRAKESSILNNILLNNSNDALSCNSCLIENNIAISNSTNYHSSCVFHNNINLGVNGVVGNGNQGSNNYLGIQFNPLFVNYSGVLDYTSNFHLVQGSLYINAGFDGTDIGIYGGLYPWKEGSVPFNPHIQLKNIANTTDANGNLNINIQVGAQDH